MGLDQYRVTVSPIPRGNAPYGLDVESMLLPMVDAIVTLSGLKQLMPPVARHFAEAAGHRVHLGAGERLQGAGQSDVLLQLGHRRDSHYLGRHRHAEAIAIGLIGGEPQLFDDPPLKNCTTPCMPVDGPVSRTDFCILFRPAPSTRRQYRPTGLNAVRRRRRFRRHLSLLSAQQACGAMLIAPTWYLKDPN